MSTIFAESPALNGEFEGSGLEIGATVTTAVPVAPARFNLISGRAFVAGIIASDTPTGTLTTFEFGVVPGVPAQGIRVHFA